MILPFERSYWVIPGKFLAGRIPSSPDVSRIRETVEALVGLEIDCVINLTEADEKTFSGALLNDYAATLREVATQVGRSVEVIRMSIPDLSIPSVPFMKKILNKIEQVLTEGKSVYVHCWGGVGRTGTVVGCYLQRKGYTNKENVLEMIEYLKRTTDLVNRLSPETDEQRDFVLHWQKNS